MAQLRISGIRDLPVPDAHKVREREQELVSLSRRIAQSNSPHFWKKLNELVYELYGVSKAQKYTIENWCKDISL